MADGARFDINIEAKAIGVDSSADQLNTLVERMTKTTSVATIFDKAVAAARARLDEASVSAASAARALGVAEGRYKELESAANKAAKQVEKAAAAGKDTTALRAAADAAIAKAREQGVATDALRAKSIAASKAQTQLAESLKTLEAQQEATRQATKAAAEQAANKSAASAAKLESFVMGATAAFVGLAVAAGAGVLSLAKFGFGVQTNVANMQRLTMAQQRMQLGMQRLFKGLQWDKFTRGLEDVMTLFDEGTSSANGMKMLIETILQPLIDGATKAAPLVKEMFKGLIYGALQVVIAVLKIRNSIFKAMSPEMRAEIKAVSDQVFTLKNAFTVGETAAEVLAAVVAALGVAFAVGSIPVMLIVVSVQRVIAIFNWLTEEIPKAIDAIGDFASNAIDAAGDIVDGIVTGIKDNAKKVWQALKDLALGGIKAFQNVLRIGSPSKVFALQAKYTADGYVQGIEQSTPEVNSALETMVDPAAATSGAIAPSSTSTSTSSSSTKSVTIQQLTIGGGEVAASNWSQLRQMLVELVGDGNLTIGGGEAPAT